jgi:DNA-binding Xre family transcriptional regulator
MGHLTQFKSPSGDEMVVLSRSEYDALVEAAEMLADVAAYDRAKARIAVGEDEMIPAEFVYRMMDGESPLRVWREYRKLSAKDLAAQVGISTAYLSEMETGKKEGSLSVLKAIASVLAVDLDDLVWTRADDTE